MTSTNTSHRTRNLTFGLAALLLSLPACVIATQPDSPPPQQRDDSVVGVVFNAHGERVSQADAVTAMAAARFAFVGEKHDNPDHHRIEADLITARLEKQPGSAIVFEMLDDAQRPLLPKASAADDIDSLRVALAWPEKGWDLDVYGPLFQATLRNGQLVAGNIGKDLIGQIYSQGEAVLAGNPRFGSVPLATAATRQHLLDSIFEAHCRMQERSSLQPMLAIQLAKDASMAAAMDHAKPAMLIAGGEHARNDTGVPSHLRAIDPTATRIVIQLIEATADHDDPQEAIKQAGPADYYWFTTATEAKDYCAEVKGRAAQ